MQLLEDIEIERWLLQHIPYRVRAALAGCLNIEGDWKMPPVSAAFGDAFHICCIGSAVGEGKRVAMRWLIELIGIAGTDQKTGLPNRPTIRFGTVTLEMLGTQSFDVKLDKAKFLSNVWKGCSQASGASYHEYESPACR